MEAYELDRLYVITTICIWESLYIYIYILIIQKERENCEGLVANSGSRYDIVYVHTDQISFIYR